MGITSETRKAIEEARKTARKAIEIAKTSEDVAISKMLDLCREEDRPMTAKEISARMKNLLSVYEVAGNLVAMRNELNHWSRFDNRIAVKTPRREGEKVKIREKKTYGMVRELDENGNEIIGTEKKIVLNRKNTYQIIKK